MKNKQLWDAFGLHNRSHEYFHIAVYDLDDHLIDYKDNGLATPEYGPYNLKDESFCRKLMNHLIEQHNCYSLEYRESNRENCYILFGIPNDTGYNEKRCETVREALEFFIVAGGFVEQR